MDSTNRFEKKIKSSKSVSLSTILFILNIAVFSFAILLVTSCKSDDRDSIDDINDGSTGDNLITELVLFAPNDIVDMAKDVKHTIKITVDADRLYNSDQNDVDRIAKYTSLSSNKERSNFDCFKKNFTVDVNPTNTIEWRIEKSGIGSDSYIVELEKIVYKEGEGSSDFFDQPDLERRGSQDYITGKIKKKLSGYYYDYGIHFSIKQVDSNDNPVTYEIDPKLRLHVSTFISAN